MPYLTQRTLHEVAEKGKRARHVAEEFQKIIDEAVAAERECNAQKCDEIAMNYATGDDWAMRGDVARECAAAVRKGE